MFSCPERGTQDILLLDNFTIHGMQHEILLIPTSSIALHLQSKQEISGRLSSIH